MVLNNFTEYNIEFSFCSSDSYKIYNLQYLGDINIAETKHYMKFNNKKIKSFEFLPSVDVSATLCILISFDDCTIDLINSDSNEIIHEYKLNSHIINKIMCGLFFLYLIIFNENIKREIKHESKIISSEIDIYDFTGRALLFTDRGFLYYDYYPERKKIKLYGFNSEEKYITNIEIVNNFTTDINEIKKLSHYIITSHKGGYIKIFSISSFDVIYEFRENNIEITYLLRVPKKSLIIFFYNNGNMKCFDIKQCKFTGIINILDIIGNNYDNNAKGNIILK